RIHTDATHSLAEATCSAVDFGRGHWRGRDAACGVWKSPSSRCVPNVLNRRVIVECDAENQLVVIGVGAAEGKMVCIADVGVIESEVIPCAIVSQLYETPQ